MIGEHGYRTRAATVTKSIASLVVCLIALAACSGAKGADGTSPTAGDASWSFTDGRGTTTELPSTPQRIVAYEESAAYLMGLGVQPVGEFGSAPIDQNPYFKDLDTSGVASVGDVYGEVNLEETVALRPDLIVTTHYFPDDVSWGFSDDQQAKKFEQVAPIISIARDASPATILESYGDLAASLGADMNAPEITDSIDSYQTALDHLKTAIESNPEISVMGISGGKDLLYVAAPSTHPDFFDYKKVGLSQSGPKEPDKGLGVWTELSWENAAKYPADIILFDNRPGNLGASDLKAIPSFAALPAVKAGQLAPWYVGQNYTWDLYAKHTEELATLIENAQDVA